MAKIELTEIENSKLKTLMAQGMSKGEALVKMGKAVKKEIVVENEAPKEKKKREVKIDPIKDFLITEVMEHFKDASIGTIVTDKGLKLDISCILRDGTKKVDMTINGESYTLTLTKKRPVK